MTTEIVYGFLLSVPRALLDEGNAFDYDPQIYTMHEIDFAGVNADDDSADDDTDTVLIGCSLAEGEYQYSGVLAVPEVPQSVKDMVAQLQADNDNLNGLKPKLYVYFDSEK